MTMTYDPQGIDAAMWLRVADVVEAIFALDPDQDEPPRRRVYDALMTGRLTFGMRERGEMMWLRIYLDGREFTDVALADIAPELVPENAEFDQIVAQFDDDVQA
jgi:hypothetical protein